MTRSACSESSSSAKAARRASRRRSRRRKLYNGVGVVIATVPRGGRLIVNHEEIPGFMAAMEMSYPGHAAVVARRTQSRR